MPIKIYWGPPGSYKTSSAVQEDVAACAKAGRVLITNVRGLSEARIRENAPAVSPGFKLIHLRNDDPEELRKLRTWWHWAPFGAFILLDEIQLVYPLKWTDAQVRSLDAPEGRAYDYVDQEGEPQKGHLPRELDLIFDMHRHGNWDLTFTLPSIKKVRPEIRGAAECAYKHKNMAIHGGLFRGKFLQMQHSAEDNGNPSDIYIKRTNKIQPWVFKCYDSTATGTVSDTKVGLSIFANPKLLLLCGVVLLGLGVLLFVGMPRALGGGDPPPAKVPAAARAPAPSGVPGGPQAHKFGVPNGPAVTPAPVTSKTDFRLLGVTLLARPRRSYAIVYSPSTGDVRVPLDLCKRDHYAGWFCTFEGQLITERSGSAPPKPDMPRTLLAEAVAPST